MKGSLFKKDFRDFSPYDCTITRSISKLEGKYIIIDKNKNTNLYSLNLDGHLLGWLLSGDI